MLPAVARRSPASTTPWSQTAATSVVAWGRSRTAGESAAWLTAEPGARPGSRSGEWEARNSANDEVCRSMKPAGGLIRIRPGSPSPPANGPDCRNCAEPSRYEPNANPPPKVVGTAVPSTDPTAVPERDSTPKTPACPPTANRRARLLAALLHVRPDELLRVLLEDFVDLVQDRVDIVGELFVALPDLLGGPGLRLLGLLGAPGGLPLTACVLVGCHVATSVCPNAIVTRGSPAQSRRAQIGTNSRPVFKGADPGRSVLASQGGDQLGRGPAAVQQLAHVRLG